MYSPLFQIQSSEGGANGPETCPLCPPPCPGMPFKQGCVCYRDSSPQGQGSHWLEDSGVLEG